MRLKEILKLFEEKIRYSHIVWMWAGILIFASVLIFYNITKIDTSWSWEAQILSLLITAYVVLVFLVLWLACFTIFVLHPMAEEIDRLIGGKP